MARLAEVCDEVLVAVAPGEEPAVPAGARLVHDSEPHLGPLGGVVAGLEAAAGSLLLVVGGDMPTLSPAVLRELRDDAHETGAGAVALAEGDDVRPLPCALRREALAVARGLLAGGEGSLRALLRAVGVRAVPEEVWRALDPGADSLRDVDRREDLD